METDSSAWTQADLDAVGLSDDEMYSMYGEEFYDNQQEASQNSQIWGTDDTLR